MSLFESIPFEFPQGYDTFAEPEKEFVYKAANTVLISLSLSSDGRFLYFIDTHLLHLESALKSLAESAPRFG